MIRIPALRETIESGELSYPIYLALMQADVISGIADVPSYSETTTNADIASNVSTIPVKEWQRPRIRDKVRAIRRLFSNSGEFMPNPVLVGESPHASVKPRVAPLLVGGDSTSVWELEIDQGPSGSEKPLWILDGQHRIAGLSESAQPSNPVPVVFLLNEGSNHYSADTLAKIFAHVTMSATPLGTLHREWLSYAFNLNHSDSHIQARDLPDGEKLQALPAALRQLHDTLRMIAYRAESAMALAVAPELDSPDTARNLLKALFRSDASLRPDPAAGTLTVRLLHLATRAQDQALAPLIEELNRTRTVFPGTQPRLVYEMQPSDRPGRTVALPRPTAPTSLRAPP